MILVRVETIGDPRIAHYRDLPSSNLTRHSGLFIVEGHLLVERLLASGYAVESILVDGGRADRLPPGLPDGITVYQTIPGLVPQIIGFNFHRGILACGRRKPALSLTDVLPAGAGPLTVVVAADIHDPTNLGGILRSSAAFGVDSILLSRRCADPFSRRVLRVSMGATLRLPIVCSDNLAADLTWMRDELGLELVATVLQEGAEILETASRVARMAILFGNEGHGLPEELVVLCQRRVTVPMCAGADSLNAAVAAGVFLYHFSPVRHHLAGPSG